MNEEFETYLHVQITLFDGTFNEYFMTYEEYDEMTESWDSKGVKRLVIDVLEDQFAEG